MYLTHKRVRTLFNLFKTKRIYCIGDVAIPQMKIGLQWFGICKEGFQWSALDYQVKYCGLPTAQEAEKLLRTINIIYPKGL